MAQKLWIYVLELAVGRYYVGKSDDVEKRFNDHLTGFGSAWTKKYKPVRIGTIIQCTGPTHEDSVVKEMMMQHGINMVRGGSYSNIVLTTMQTAALEAEMCGAADKCMRCGRSGHWISSCYASRDVNGEFIGDASPSKPQPVERKQPMEPQTTGAVCRGLKKAEAEAKPGFWKSFGIALAGAITAMEANDASRDGEGPNENSDTCFRCGRAGHWQADCYASRHVDGGKLAK